MKLKKITAIVMSVCLAFGAAACGGKADNSGQESSQPESAGNADVAEGTFGADILSIFRAHAGDGLSAQEMADVILNDPVIPFSGASMPVEEGLLTGFGNAEITGFTDGVMFAPMIGSIPFVGYVFTVGDGQDAQALADLLRSNADKRWNVCTEADDMIVEISGNQVFFVMCPTSAEEE